MTTPTSESESHAEAVGADYVMSKFASARDLRQAMIEEIAVLRRAETPTIAEVRRIAMQAIAADSRDPNNWFTDMHRILKAIDRG